MPPGHRRTYALTAARAEELARFVQGYRAELQKTFSTWRHEALEKKTLIDPSHSEIDPEVCRAAYMFIKQDKMKQRFASPCMIKYPNQQLTPPPLRLVRSA